MRPTGEARFVLVALDFVAAQRFLDEKAMLQIAREIGGAGLEFLSGSEHFFEPQRIFMAAKRHKKHKNDGQAQGD
jgi:hypothetical protein